MTGEGFAFFRFMVLGDWRVENGHGWNCPMCRDNWRGKRGSSEPQDTQ